MKELVRIQPRLIVYVSCYPSTLARDVFELTKGGYSLTSVDMIELFSQTHHVEVVASLRSNKEKAR